MALLKIVRHSDGNLLYMANMLNYILDDRALSVGVNGISCYGTNQEISQRALHEMLFVREYFGKVSGNPLIHFIISYDSNVKGEIMASWITHRIACFLADRYQYIWVLHYKPRKDQTGHYTCYHAHIVINSVSYADGKMYSGSLKETHTFAQHIANVTETAVSIEHSSEKSDGSMSSFHDNCCIRPVLP